MTAKRMRYTAKLKLAAIKHAEQNNNCAAAREFGVNEKLIRDWRKIKDKIANLPKNKCADRGKKCEHPDLEREMKQWIEDHRQNGMITRNATRLKALSIAKAQKINNFKASPHWCTRFMKRNDLVMRTKTKMAQKLPADLDEKVTSFLRYVINLRKKVNYEMAHIGNMDETPVWFDMPAPRTIDGKGKKTVMIKTSGHGKSRFTVVLTCMADGTRLKPMIIFKRKTMPKEKFPPDVVIHVHPKGWMNTEGIRLWIDKVWARRPGGLHKKRSMLVWDAFRAHLDDNVKAYLRNEHATDLSVIPGGLTSIVQPLDVCLNKPFKDRLRKKWINWMMEGEKTFTPTGNMRRPDLAEVAHCVSESWKDIEPNMIMRSFKKCGISNSLDGTEDDILWQDDDDEDTVVQESDGEDDSEDGNDEEFEDGDDPYDTALSHNEVDELFGDSDSEEEFHGFANE